MTSVSAKDISHSWVLYSRSLSPAIRTLKNDIDVGSPSDSKVYLL